MKDEGGDKHFYQVCCTDLNPNPKRKEFLLSSVACHFETFQECLFVILLFQISRINSFKCLDAGVKKNKYN